MDKKHTLVGEDFFRMMMRHEDERKRRSMVHTLRNVDDGETQSLNVVSLERYRREHNKPIKRPAI
jgi:hypothetical protein